MSDKPHHKVNIVTPEEYGKNLAQIQAAKSYVAEMERANEAGRENYEGELLRKVREGEEARRRLQDLELVRNSSFNRPLAIEAAPTSARIEEVSPQNTQWAATHVTPRQPYYQSTGFASPQSTTAGTPYNTNPYGADKQQHPVEQQPNLSFIGQTLNAQQALPQQYYYTFQSNPHAPPYIDPSRPSGSQLDPSQQGRRFPVPNGTAPATNRGYSFKVRSTTVPRNAPSSQSPWIPAGNQTSATQAPSSSTQGDASISRPPSNGEKVQNLQRSLHYSPTSAQESAMSSLTNALSQPQYRTSQALNSFSPSTNTISNSVNFPREVDPQPPTAATPALNDKELTKNQILKFREIILAWGNSAKPGTSQTFNSIQVRKDAKRLRITSMVDKQTFDESFDDFFVRLWLKAGLPLGALPLISAPIIKQSSSIKSMPHFAVPALPKGKSTSSSIHPSVPVHNTAISSLPSSPTASKLVSQPPFDTPSTPTRHKTLVDVERGTWRSSVDADKKRLARDVMFALGKRKHEPTPLSRSSENASKRHAVDILSSSSTLAPISAPALQPITGALSTSPSTSTEQQQYNTRAMSSGVIRSTPSPSVVDLEAPGHALASTGPNADLAFQVTTAIPDAPQSMEPEQAVDQTLARVSPAALVSESGGTPVKPNVVPRHDLSWSQASVAVLPTPAINLQPHIAASSTTIREPGLAQSTSSLPPHTDTSFSLGSSLPQMTFIPSWPSIKSSVTSPSFLQESLSYKSSSINQNTTTTDSQHFVPTSSVPTTHEKTTSEITIDVDLAMDVLPSPATDARLNHFDTVSHDVVAPSPKPAEPLFLPSPSPSPSPLTSPTPVSYINKGKGSTIHPPSSRSQAQGKGIAKHSSVYILVPPPPEYLVRHREQEAKLAKRLSQNGSARNFSVVSGSVDTSTSSEDLILAFETERESAIDSPEIQAVQLSCSRLQVLPCRWDRCDVVLNSRESLLRHLNQEHKPIPNQGANIQQSFICRWTQCGRQCNIRENHFERHALVPFHCAFKDCKETHRSSGQLRKHFETAHINGEMRPQATPFIPKDLDVVLVPNAILPTYLIVEPPVQPCAISRDSHANLAPWVWHNISGSDERPEVAEAGNDYAFLNNRATRYSWIHSQPVNMDFADLQSEEISRQCDSGLTFFAEDDEMGGDSETQERPERSSSPLSTSPMKESSNPNTAGEGNRLQLSIHADDDEGSVERLLLGDMEIKGDVLSHQLD